LLNALVVPPIGAWDLFRMSLQLPNRIAVVTGGANGIGKQIALQLAKAGAEVVVLDIAKVAADAVVLAIRDQGGRGESVCCDVADRTAIFAAFDSLREAIGPPTILVNNAGLFKSAELAEVAEVDWNRIMSVNLSGAFWCAQAAARDLGRDGRIVNIASIGGKIGWARNHAYCASKSGLIGLTRVLALELAPRGITVNAICPGNTDTAMMQAVDAAVSSENGWPRGEFVRQLKDRIPLQRLALPADIADLVVYLCRPEAGFITGQAINVDGGLVMY
jgi:NAD(P)-dependent dehydrogenase (short-subunit alcohol dehydrogenase family)